MTKADVLTTAFIDETMRMVGDQMYCSGQFAHTDVLTVVRIVRETLEYQRRPTFTWSIEIKAETEDEARDILGRDVLRETSGAFSNVRVKRVTEGE